MSKSGESVDYVIRVNKHIERKMLVETFRRLAFFNDLRNYQYIGLGSKYFVDFSLFHKELGIEKMYSIESDIPNELRFKFNKPYHCIEFCSGTTQTILPIINLSMPTILWLDFDDCFNNDMLIDIETITTKIQSGSLLIISANSSLDKENDLRLEWCRLQFGHKFPDYNDKENRPIEEKDVTPKVVCNIIRDMILAEINRVVNDRNVIFKGTDEELKFLQLYNFTYKDNAPMYTFGGIIINKRDEDTLEKCNFESFNFVRTDASTYNIAAPYLTSKEVDLFNKHIHNEETVVAKDLKEKSISQSDFNKYKDIYRYYPTFRDVSIG